MLMNFGAAGHHHGSESTAIGIVKKKMLMNIGAA
jgi:hypothetical protein